MMGQTEMRLVLMTPQGDIIRAIRLERNHAVVFRPLSGDHDLPGNPMGPIEAAETRRRRRFFVEQMTKELIEGILRDLDSRDPVMGYEPEGGTAR